MNLFGRTIKSFSRKEKWAASLLLIIFFASLIKLTLLSQNEAATKTYSEGIVGELVHLNPVFTEFSEADADASSLIFSGLVRYNPVTVQFEEDIATHILSEDKLTYTFTLKNNVFWHDGIEVTADDIYYTFAEVIQAEDFKNPILKSNFEGVKIEKVNSRTVSFTLGSPNSFFFTALTVGLLPKHILGEVPVAELDTHEFNNAPIGTGPYQIAAPYEIHEDGSSSVMLTVYPEYYGEIPTLKQLRFVAYPTLEDLAENRSVWHGAARLRESMFGGLDLTNLVTYQYELPQYTALFFNTDSPFLEKNKARLGISKAIFKDEILEAISYNVAIDTPLLELSQEEWIHQSDLEEAKGALFDAGWPLPEGESVRKNAEGEDFSLRLIRRDFSLDNSLQEETSSTTAKIIQKQLGGVGIDVSIEAYPQDELEEKIRTRDYDMLLYGQSLGYNLDTFSYWHSSQSGETGLNFSNYQNPKADFIIESIRTTFDASERQELLTSLANIIAEDVPAVFLYTPSYFYLVDTGLTGLNFQKLLLPKDRLANIAEWEFN